MKSQSLVIIVISLVIEFGGTTDLTVHINPGQEECFFEIILFNQTLNVDYAVIGSSQGEHDINFQLSDPFNRPMVTEFRKSDASHSIPVAHEGLHKMCFDNTFSHFSKKTIAFGISAQSDQEAQWAYNEKYLEPEGTYEVNIEDIQQITNRVRIHMSTIQRLQQEFREVESRDRSVIEQNYERINFWSTVNLVILVFVGVVQVIMVKSLFDDKYKVHKLLNFK